MDFTSAKNVPDCLLRDILLAGRAVSNKPHVLVVEPEGIEGQAVSNKP